MFGHVGGDLLKRLSDGTAFSWIRSKLEKQPNPVGESYIPSIQNQNLFLFRFAVE